MFRKSLAFIAAASLTAAPALAQSAAALSIAPAASSVRAGPSDASDSNFEGGFGLPAIVFAAIVIGGVLLATGVLFNDDHPPSSP